MQQAWVVHPFVSLRVLPDSKPFCCRLRVNRPLPSCPPSTEALLWTPLPFPPFFGNTPAPLCSGTQPSFRQSLYCDDPNKSRQVTWALANGYHSSSWRNNGLRDGYCTFMTSRKWKHRCLSRLAGYQESISLGSYWQLPCVQCWKFLLGNT